MTDDNDGVPLLFVNHETAYWRARARLAEHKLNEVRKLLDPEFRQADVQTSGMANAIDPQEKKV